MPCTGRNLQIGKRIGLFYCAVLALLLDQFRDKTSPSGLMRRAETGTCVTMIIFMEPIAIAVALLIESLNGGAQERCFAIFSMQPDADKPIRKLVRNAI